MRNKIYIYIIGILFIISLSLTIIGLLSKGSEKEEIAPDYPNSIQKITFNNDQQEIDSFISKIESFDFYHANKDFESSYIKGSINNNEITINVSKTGINNATDEMAENITYTVKDIINPQASKAQISDSEGNPVRVYTLDKYGRLLLSEFNADPTLHNGITTYLIDIKNISSFAVLNIPLVENSSSDQIYTVFKTKDGTYYTDYLFTEGVEHQITKVIDITPEIAE